MHIRKTLLRLIPSDASLPTTPIPNPATRSSIAVVVHTCDAYEFCWRGWHHYFQAHWDPALPWNVYFLNEETYVELPGVIHRPTGVGEWSDRLRRGLEAIPEENVLYLQEDFWPTSPIPALRYFDVFRALDMHALRIAPESRHYSVFRRFSVGGLPVHRFSRLSHYLVSHQASIWKKDFLLACLAPGENPWVNEERGTERLQRSRDPLRIYLSPSRWYAAVCRGGQLTAQGMDMMHALADVEHSALRIQR